MSEATEQQVVERDRNNALMITNLQAEIDRLTVDRDAWRLTAKTFERASGAAPRQAVAFRCDNCDNGVETEWKYCAWCGATADWKHVRIDDGETPDQEKK